MDGPSRSGGLRQSRRSRSQRDRERRRRRADLGASSPSSGSEQERCRESLLGASGGECRPVFPGARHRPPRRRKRESVSCEEDIIDGFAIASFISLEALEMDCSLKPPERAGMLMGRGSKRKRGLDENGGPLTEPEEAAPATYTTSSWLKRKNDKKKREAKCDAESESGDKASDNDMEPTFIVSTREVSSLPVSMASAVSNGCALLPANSGPPRLSVTPRVSGLERSQERSLELPYPEATSTSSSLLLPRSPASVSTSLAEQNGNAAPHHRRDCSPPQHKPKSFLSFGSRSQVFGMGLINRNSTSVKTPSSSAASSTIRPSTPSTSVPAGRGPSGPSGVLRPSSRPSPGALFTPPPGLPPPPPLLQVSPRSSADPELLRQELNSHFLAAQSTERDGRASGSSAGVSANSASGGASVSSSNSGNSSRAVQAQASIPPMAYQFHQHNHQHQHTHTHQHFLHPPTAAPPMFDKFPGKIDGLFRHPLVALQGTAPEMPARLGVVPPHLQPKDPRLMQADPQKLELRNDLLPRLPGPGGIGGIGGLGALGGPLPPTHDLTRPGSLFAPASGVNPSTTSFIPPSAPHSSFLTPATHLDPYGRSPPFPPLGALGAGAFGGLGSPSLGASSVFGHKAESSSAVGGLGNPHDPWNRLHVAPPFPSGPSWAKGLEKRDDRDRGKEMGGRELTQIKDEKDRDSLLYGRQPVRMSPGALKHRSSTPSSHMNGLGPLSVVAPQSDSVSQNREREKERERDRESDKRHLSSSRVPASTSLAPDRPRSSTSSVLATPPPNARSASSPLDLFGRQAHGISSESLHPSQRESSGPASSSSSVSSLPVKKPDRTTTPVSKQPPGMLHPPVKVKEERKEEPEPVPISLSHPSVPPHSFERPNSRHTHHPSTPSSTLSLTPTPGVPLPPPTPHATHHHLPLLDRSRLAIEAYLGGNGGPAGLVVGAPGDRFAAHPHTPPQGHSQAPHSFPWDPWRELAAQQQQRREILAQRPDHHLALRTDPHLSRLLQHQHARYLEAERAAAVAAAVAVGPHHPVVPSSTSSASASVNRPDFGLISHPFDRPPQVGGPGGGLLDEEQRAQILREDFERVRYFGMHPHLSTPHLPSPSHAAHLDQLHAGLLSHAQLHPTGGAAPSHHPGLYSRLGPLHPHSHVPNGILAKTPGLVAPLSVGAPPPLIPSVTRASTPPRRLGGAGAVCSSSRLEGGRLKEEVVQQRTPPAVAVLGGIPTATQNVAGPPQHVLQPVPAASLLPPPLLGPGTKMEQQKANMQSANQAQATWQNCNTLQKKPTLDCSTEAIQRQPVNMAAENSQNTPSDRLSSCDTGQELHYGYNTEKTGLESREKKRTDHCQDWTPNPGAANKDEKGHLPPEKTHLECNSKTDKEEVRETKHMAKQITCVSTTQSSSSVSAACKKTDAAQSSLLLVSDVQQIVQESLSATITTNVEVLNESTDSSNSMSKGPKGKSAKKEKSVSGQPDSTGNGNGTPDNTDEDDGRVSEIHQQTSLVAFSTPASANPQKTPHPSNHPKNTHVAQAKQLSPDCMNCSEPSKSVLTVTKTSMSCLQEIKNLPSDGISVGLDISVKEPKVLGEEICTHNIQAPKVIEGSHLVACSTSQLMAKQNDCAKSMQMSPYKDHKPDGRYVLLNKNKCENSEGLDSNEQSLLQVKTDCLVQQGQESILVDDKLPQMECLNDGILTTDDMSVDEKHECLDAFAGLNAVEMKDFIDVGILVQPGMEDTWLVVSDHSSLLDGQCQSTEDTEIINVNTESIEACPEAETSVAVYECSVPCFPPDAIHEAAKLLLPEKEVEVHADKPSFEPLTETLTQDLDTLSSHPPIVLKSENVLCSPTSLDSENIGIQSVISEPQLCSIAENTDVLDSALISSSSTVQGEQMKFITSISNSSQVSLSTSIIDPKLLILKRGEALLKQPLTLTPVSRNQSPSGPSNDCVDQVSVECLSGSDLTTDVTDGKAALSPLSFHVLNAPCNATASFLKDESKKQALIKSEHLIAFEKLIPQNEANLISESYIQSQTHDPSRLPSRSDSMSTTITEQPEDPAHQPCQDSMLLELEEHHLSVQHLEEIKDAQDSAVEHLDACIEECSEGEADGSLQAKNNKSIAIPCTAHKTVCQWIAGRGTTSSTPSTSRTPSPPPASLSADWKHSLPSPQNSAGTSQSDHSLSQRPRSEKHTDMAELAKHEAEIEHRTLALKREGFWSLKRLSRVAEPLRPKVHWDYLCEEMQWLSADFAQERRWKRGVARKVVRMVMRHHEELRQKEERAKREEHAKLRRIAASIAKEVRAFWSSVEKVVQYKQQSRLEEKRKKALDLQLDFIVGQTERYSDLLSQSLKATPAAPASVSPQQRPLKAPEDEDIDFEPPCEEDDDEETIEVEEQQEGNDAESHRKEIELLKQESTLPLDQLLGTLTLPQGSASENEVSDDSSSTVEDEDKEFSANEEDSEDVEDTIEAQEVIEGDGDHEEELDDLAKEGELSMEELLEKYKGAYASDYEEPLATSESSEATEDEEEEETEGDESDNASLDSTENSDEEDDTEAEESEKEEDNGGEGMEVLLREGAHSPTVPTSPRPKKEISHIAATAESLQPKGYTLATTSVKTPIPFLLYGNLREYQHIGLDWLVTMFEKKLNGILADEMGLGKTIQTIALLAHLACEKGNWGPHLIIVPTSVMLNWEMELKRWCPGFKILTYYGSQKERKLKRQGWTKPNAFHVCITSYKLVLQDHQAFRRKSWKYLILDEAQNIKNFKSQRWQSLLNFNSHRRLLLTGTPLQNSLMELWSLMHFLMPHVFQSHREFKEWFSNPLTGMIEGSQEYNEGLVKRLHKVLRPFLLRRIKADVEKQMPKKYEHVVRCRLSKRQRFLYDDFMAQASTKETLASGHFMSVINILMQLRKVCNHPNLFDPRPIQSPFIAETITYSTASLVLTALDTSPFQRCDFAMFDLVGLEGRVSRYQADVYLPQRKVTRQLIQEIMESPEPLPRPKPIRMKVNRMFQPLPKSDGRSTTANNPRPTCSDSPAVQSPRLPLNTEVTQAPVQPTPQVCPVTPVAASQASVCQSVASLGSTNPVMSIRHAPLSTVPTVAVTPQPSSNVMTQRVLLSPDMQARLPSGEVVSIAQLASLAGRPVSSSQGSKPVTFQLQGNKLTLSGAPLQVPVAQPRSIQGSVMHLVSSGGQHHLISQPAQVAVLHTISQSGSISANSNPTSTIPSCSGLAVPLTAAQVQSPRVSGPGIVKIVVRQAAGKEGGQVPTLAVPASPRAAPPQSVLLHPHGTSSALRPTTPQQTSQRLPVHLTPPQAPTSCLVQTPSSSSGLKVVERTLPSTGFAKANASLEVEDSSSDPTHKPMTTSQSRAFGFQRPLIKPQISPRTPFYMSWLADRTKAQRDDHISRIFRVNELHCNVKPVFGQEVLDFLTFLPGPSPTPAKPVFNRWNHSGYSSCLIAQSQHKRDYLDQSKILQKAIKNSEERLYLMSGVIERFIFVIPPVEAKPITMHSCHPPPSRNHQQALLSSTLSAHLSPLMQILHSIRCNMRTLFPDLRLIQYDCGKLQTLHLLLRKLRSEGHRVLIFTQMTRMLDILEQFLNYHGHIYLRLDGSTRVEQRQALMERFNADRRIFCFILSTRSGGVGVNLTGADTVVFYDSDWNPTMDAQAQDRCHRIGQTRDVHIYRLISERTVEENILKKANQKRMLGDMAIEGGNFTTAFFKQQTIRELFDVYEGEKKDNESSVPPSDDEEAVNKQQTTILEQALCRAEDEEDIVAASQAKAEQVAELAEFNENIPLDDNESRDQEEEELSKAEQEIAALVEQLTPIERYAMNFLEASLEDICKEELKQAEEQVEAARKGLDQAKEEGLKLHQSSDNDEDDSIPHTPDEHQPARRTRRHREKGAPSTRVSGRLRGTPAKIDEDMSTTHPSLDNERRRRGETSVNHAPSSVKSSQAQEMPERFHSCIQGRTETEDVASTSQEPIKLQLDQRLSDTERSSMPSQFNQSFSPVPSDSASSSVDRNSSGHTLTLTTIFKDTSDEHVVETDTNTSEQMLRERRTSMSSESICSPEHHSDQDGQPSLFPSLASPHSRSPRKRQSADEEVLKGLPEDSPSAKVLRKLPGRLVTVVEDKEPKRRKRGEGGSGGVHTEGSSEETEQTESSQDTIPLSPIHSFNDKAFAKSPSTSSPETQQVHEQTSPSSLSNPGRSYHSYSPTHHSPDMPVLRNLPVRRRLETESRMAAQLGEHFLGRGKGLDRRTPLSPKKQEPILSKDGSTISNVASVANATCFSPGKRKRGRPPKMSPKPSEQDTTVAHKSISEEQSPPQSPKRKRGRPRKDSTTNATDNFKPEKEASCLTSLAIISQESLSAENLNLHSSSPRPLIMPTVLECPRINSVADGTSESFKTTDSAETSKTDTQNTQFNPISPLTPSESQSRQTASLEMSNDQTKATGSKSVPLEAQPQFIHTENDIQTNIKPSSLLAASTANESFDSSATTPAKECIALSTSEVCQSSQVTTSSQLPTLLEKSVTSEISVEINQCPANSKVSSTPAELLAQPTFESSASGASPLRTSLDFAPTSKDLPLSSEHIMKTNLQPSPVSDLTQSSVQPDIPLETKFNTNQTHVFSQLKPALTETMTTHSSQITTAPVSFPDATFDVSQPSPASKQGNKNLSVPAEKRKTENQEDPIMPEEDGLLETSEEIQMNIFEKPEKAETDNSQLQAKKRKLEDLPEDQRSFAYPILDTMMQTVPPNVADAQLEEDNQTKEQKSKSTGKNRNICRQSSQESFRSSSPSSVSSSGTLSTQSKHSTENSMPAKRTRIERDLEKDADRGSDQEPLKSEGQCSSSDTEDSSGKERRLTRSSHKSLEQDTMCNKRNKNSNCQKGSDKKVAKELASSASAPVRVTRKSIGTQPTLKLTSLNLSEPQVLGKRCSALNAAAKLLAMRGKGPDPPNACSKSKQSNTEKFSKFKDKQDQESPKKNSVVNKSESSLQTPTRLTDSLQSTPETDRSASRSTRQRPGNLVPPLETEAKRAKTEEKKKTSDRKEDIEEENRETRSSRGHSACSSVSSERWGAGSSRSRSSSNSSQCTRSLSSRSTGPAHSHSRAPSSGSDTEKGKGRQKKTGENRGRESRRERYSKNNEKPQPGGVFSEGTPDRVLRSVAALAAAQARTPASNTRSSSSQQRHSKT
ncbi:Helicase domino [Bagarius yarrelli]|uniref:Helicase domino n=1 Tax=Bagarius yarrelli TaxID=175774 RepID=A0A556TIY2_BAGYA|nr:Helicase domino [Bagarius yarrelli]